MVAIGLNLENLAKLKETIESGQYEKCTCRLCDGPKRCVVGIASELAGYNPCEPVPAKLAERLTPSQVADYYYDRAREWLGVIENTGRGTGLIATLYAANDDKNTSNWDRVIEVIDFIMKAEKAEAA